MNIKKNKPPDNGIPLYIFFLCFELSGESKRKFSFFWRKIKDVNIKILDIISR